MSVRMGVMSIGSILTLVTIFLAVPLKAQNNEAGDAC